MCFTMAYPTAVWLTAGSAPSVIAPVGLGRGPVAASSARCATRRNRFLADGVQGIMSRWFRASATVGRVGARRDEHAWSQRHLSHYLEGDLRVRARRRLERHAADCPECNRGIRALAALLRLIPGVDRPGEIRAPAGAFDRVRADAGASSDPGRRGQG
jgi:Putative zinc-finger